MLKGHYQGLLANFMGAYLEMEKTANYKKLLFPLDVKKGSFKLFILKIGNFPPTLEKFVRTALARLYGKLL